MQTAGDAATEPALPELDVRLKKLEDRLTALERGLTVLVSNHVTKEDLFKAISTVHQGINAQTWRLVTFVCGCGASLAAATFAIARYVH